MLLLSSISNKDVLFKEDGNFHTTQGWVGYAGTHVPCLSPDLHGISESMEYSMEYFWGTFGVLLSTFGVLFWQFWSTFWAILEYLTSSWHDLVNNG